MKIMNDRNYKERRRNARNFQEIEIIDKWSKITTMKA